MCGIFGGVGVERVADGVFEHMAKRLAHRGPDGVSIDRVGSTVLGVVRLAIVGRSEPARVFRAGRVRSVMNGELYNHRELRKGLKVDGHSDAALVPALFAAHGPAFVERLHGPFAIALHDGRALHLVRDRLGKKPLFFRIAGRRAFFASEQKALTVTPGFSARIDAATVEAFLRRGFVRDDELLFAELSVVGPGEWVTIDEGGGVTRRRWWKLEDQVSRRRARPAQVAGALKAAVKARIPDEVSWTLLLSGGLDSTLIGAAAGRALRHGTCIERAGAGDATRARRAAKALGVQLDTMHVQPPDVASLKRALFHLEQPDAYTSWAMAPAVLQVADFLRQRGIAVALMGEGADELFLGYAWDVMQAALERGGRAVVPDARRLLGARAKYFGLTHGIAALYSPTPRAREVWLATGGGLTVGDDLASGVPADLPGARRRQLVGLGHDLLTLPIVHADRLLMAAGVEARMPFLDHRLVELSLSLDPAALEMTAEDKPLLRDLARRWLPGWKAPPKAGFSAEAMPEATVLAALCRELSQGVHVVFEPRWFRAKTAKKDRQLTWRRVVLELTARLLTR